VRQTIQSSFTDVSANYWAKDFITELTRRGILTGFPDGKFHPNEPVTRSQFAALVASVFKKTKVRNAINFKDVSTSHWAYNGIREAYEMGFLGGTSGNQFNPNQSLSRLQVLVALTRGLNYSASNSTASVLNFYSDATTIPADVRSLIAAATGHVQSRHVQVRCVPPRCVPPRCVQQGKRVKPMTENLGVKTATKGLVMVQRVVTLATPAPTVAVMMKEDGLPAIAQSD
jgi:hypothetical protein